MAIEFGVTILPDPPYGRFLELLQLAEENGFGYGWTYDSHVLWQESIPGSGGVPESVIDAVLG